MSSETNITQGGTWGLEALRECELCLHNAAGIVPKATTHSRVRKARLATGEATQVQCQSVSPSWEGRLPWAGGMGAQLGGV